MTPEQYERLPNYAKDEITLWKARAAGAERAVATLTSDDPNAPTRCSRYDGPGSWKPALEGRYRFDVTPPLVRYERTSEGDLVPANFRLSQSEGWIEVYRNDGGLHVHGASRLQVVMESANVFRIELADR